MIYRHVHSNTFPSGYVCRYRPAVWICAFIIYIYIYVYRSIGDDGHVSHQNLGNEAVDKFMMDRKFSGVSRRLRKHMKTTRLHHFQMEGGETWNNPSENKCRRICLGCICSRIPEDSPFVPGCSKKVPIIMSPS